MEPSLRPVFVLEALSVHTAERNCEERFSCSHTGQMQGGEIGSLPAVFKNNSHSHMTNDNVNLEKGDSQFGIRRWMFTLSNTLYDESFSA